MPLTEVGVVGANARLDGLVDDAFAFGCVGFMMLVEQPRRPCRTLGMRRTPSSLELALDSLSVCGNSQGNG